jgi:hypothetical protein
MVEQALLGSLQTQAFMAQVAVGVRRLVSQQHPATI